MTNERWQEIHDFIESGDPLKDIDCGEDELIDYISQLREELVKEDHEA